METLLGNSKKTKIYNFFILQLVQNKFDICKGRIQDNGGRPVRRTGLFTFIVKEFTNPY